MSSVLGLGQGPPSDRGEREFAEIAGLLELTDGSVAADIGFGNGLWSERLAKRVGARGQVLATEVKSDLVDGFASSVRRRDIRNISVVLGSASSTSLPDGCCDGMLLRLVFHSFENPESMSASLFQAMKPNGRLLVIDFRPAPEVLQRTLEARGFTTLKVVPRWQDSADLYAVLVQRR